MLSTGAAFRCDEDYKISHFGNPTARCECDFDDDSNKNYNSSESNETLAATNGADKDYADVSQPICSESCKNGCCIDTDTCLCHIGYQPSHFDKFDCEPICGDADIENTGCTNGMCIAPQVCECLDGFVLSRMQLLTCITEDDNDDGKTHEVCDTSCVFWILMIAVLLLITVPIIALIVWTMCERKTTYIIDENGNILILLETESGWLN